MVNRIDADSTESRVGQTHYGDVSLELPLAIAQVSLCRQSVASLHCVDDGHIAEEHDEHRDEEAGD